MTYITAVITPIYLAIILFSFAYGLSTVVKITEIDAIFG